MSYKLKCCNCGHKFTASSRFSKCPAFFCSSSNTSILDDVLDVAIGVAVGYATGSLIESAAETAFDAVGSLLDW
jgi:hypothetical protein